MTGFSLSTRLWRFFVVAWLALPYRRRSDAGRPARLNVGG